jgi:uncharacterized iron-regulated membrane protein
MELRRYAWILLAVAIFMIIAKTLAYRLTGSVSLLSDAIESIVNDSVLRQPFGHSRFLLAHQMTFMHMVTTKLNTLVVALKVR